MIPPDEDAAFVAAMEQVLEVYQRPEDPAFPVVAMDERPVQLLEDLRSAVPAKPGRIARRDYEYKRIDVVSTFLFTNALQGWRRVSIRERRTAIDWAEEVKYLLDAVYPEAQRVTLVCDNLNTHKIASLYKAFPAEEALGLSSRLELVHTPKHGSWLNIAEIELSIFSRQCLNVGSLTYRRFGQKQKLGRRIATRTQVASTGNLKLMTHASNSKDYTLKLKVDALLGRTAIDLAPGTRLPTFSVNISLIVKIHAFIAYRSVIHMICLSWSFYNGFIA